MNSNKQLHHRRGLRPATTAYSKPTSLSSSRGSGAAPFYKSSYGKPAARYPGRSVPNSVGRGMARQSSVFSHHAKRVIAWLRKLFRQQRILSIVIALLVVVKCFQWLSSGGATMKRRQIRSRNPTGQLSAAQVVFSWSKSESASNMMSDLAPIGEGLHGEEYTGAAPDLGDLIMNASETRIIPEDDYERHEEYRQEQLDRIDAEAGERSLSPSYWHTEELDGKQKCYRNNWADVPHPTCNNLHELVRVDKNVNIQHKGSGSMLDAWLLLERTVHHTQLMAWKQFHLDASVDAESIFKTTRDSIILDRLTASPRIMSVYSLCGVSTLVEAAVRDATSLIMPHHDGYILKAYLDALEDYERDVVPQNKMSAVEKLDMALLMAESLADVHGMEGGLVAHGDVYTDQWLQTTDGRWVLNDFNVAESFGWNPEENEYCHQKRFDGCHKNWNRPPESLKCWPVSEAIDVWELGNNIYSLLTGLWVFQDEKRTQGEGKVMEDVKHRIRAYVDPRYRTRSFIEGKLVDIMEDCWAYDFNHRPSIFEVVRRLREVKDQHAAQQEKDS